MKTLSELGKGQAFWKRVEDHQELQLPSNEGVHQGHQRREIRPATHEVELAIEWAHLGGD